MSSKILLICTFVLVCTTLSSAQYYQPPQSGIRVQIADVHDLSPNQQLDASDFLKTAYNQHTSPVDICRSLQSQYQSKYSDYLWHVVVYKAHAITALKSIKLVVNNDDYLLFATKK